MNHHLDAKIKHVKEDHLTSSCVEKREYLLMKAMFSIKDNSISEDCWLAFKCMFDRLYSEESSCNELMQRIHV